MEYIKEITVDLSGEMYFNYITAVQGDINSRYVSVKIISNNQQYIPPEGATAIIRCKKPDETNVFNDATINNDGTVSAELTPQMLAVVGNCRCEIAIHDTGGGVLTSVPFIIKVTRASIDAEIVSTNEFTTLASALSKISGADDIANTALSKSTDALNKATEASEKIENGVIPDGIISGTKLYDTITNLFHPDNYTLGVTIENRSGTIVENPDFMLTGYIPCTQDTTYYCPAGNRRRGIYYNRNKEVIDYKNYSTYAQPGPITTPSGAAFLRLSYGVTPYEEVAECDIEHFMVIYGSTDYPTKFIPYGTDADWLYTIPKNKSVNSEKINDQSVLTEHIANYAITSNKMADIRENLLNLHDCIPGKLSPDDGMIDVEQKTYFTSTFIELSEGQAFTCPEGEERCICYYDSEKQFLSSATSAGTMPECAAFLRISYKTSSFDVWNPMLCVGTEYPEKYVKPGINLLWLERNPLQEKSMGVLGDSICALHKSYINTVAYQNNMDFVRCGNNDGISDNQSVWGSPITPHTISGEPQSFLERFETLIASGGAWEYKKYQYFVIHGGANDVRLNIPLGEMTVADDFIGNLNEYTFTGALESLFRKAQKKFPAAKIIFVTNYKLQNLPKLGEYMDVAKRVCNKYSIPVLDFYNSSGLNIGLPSVKEKYWSDDTHLNEWGHLQLVNAATKFLKSCGTMSASESPESAVRRVGYERNEANNCFATAIADTAQNILPLTLPGFIENTDFKEMRICGNTIESLISGAKSANNKSVFQDISRTVNLICGDETCTITVPQTLYSISDSIYDFFDNQGNVNVNIKKIILKGTEVWRHYKNNGNYVCFYLQDNTLKAKLNSGTGLCNIVDWYANSASLTTRSGVCTTSTDNIIFFNLPCADIGNDPNKSKDAQVADFVAWLAAQSAANEPVIIYYQLATPVIMQEAGFSLLTTTNPFITTTDSTPARLCVKYTRDTKNYIDSKLAQLSTAIISLGGNINV